MLSTSKWSSLSRADFAREHYYYLDIFSTVKNEIRFSYLEFRYDFYGLIFQQRESDYMACHLGTSLLLICKSPWEPHYVSYEKIQWVHTESSS